MYSINIYIKKYNTQFLTDVTLLCPYFSLLLVLLNGNEKHLNLSTYNTFSIIYFIYIRPPFFCISLKAKYNASVSPFKEIHSVGSPSSNAGIHASYE